MSGILTKIWDLPMMLAVLLAIIMIFASGAAFGGWDWYFVAAMGAFFIPLFAATSYFRLKVKGKYSADQVYDERADRNTMRAARNGFIAGLVAVGSLPLVLAQLYGTGEMKTASMAQVCVLLFVLLVMVHAPSYAYYTDRDLE
jgi:hypothetical protein